MHSRRSRALGVALLACWALAGIAAPAGAQDTEGGLPFDTALPVSDPESTASGLVLPHARFLDIADKSAKLDCSSGVSARTGNSFDLPGIAWQYRWGGGL